VESYEDFYSLLEKLKAKGQKFDGKTLKKLAYHQLDLAAIGNAGPCKCSSGLVRKEKMLRRHAFVAKPTIDDDRDYLEQTGMLDGVLDDRNHNTGFPRWEELSNILKLWFKLCCIEIHLDSPNIRLTEAIALFKKCAAEGSIPHQLALMHISEFQSILQMTKRLNDETIRNACNQAAYTLKEFMTPDDVEIADNKTLDNYSCSSYCFRAINEH
jgi:hypothetical protein